MSYSYSSKVVVGISSRSSEKDLQWLMDFIRQTFPGSVSNVRYLQITNSNVVVWEENVRRCSVGILYHTKHQGRLNIVDVDGALYNGELRYLSDTLGNSKVLVVLDDLENCSDVERQRILEAQPSLRRLSSELLLFPEAGKTEEAYKKKGEFLKILGISAPPPRVHQASAAKYKASSYIPSIFSPSNWFPKDNAKCKPTIKPRLNIGIFSRSAQSDYQWLMDWLKTSCDDIRAVHITNNYNKFYSEVPHCSFAILYHTKKQGRLNITDVTDSLYNEELKELSKRLGKENVIVVIDDLQNTNPDEKKRILWSQPSIDKLACNLFLFNEKNKNPENLENIKRIIMKARNEEVMDTGYQQTVLERKTDKSSKSAMHLYQDPSRDRADYRPTASGSSSCKDGSNSGEPETKKVLLDPSTLTLHSSQALAEVGIALQDARSWSISSSEKANSANSKWQNCQKVIQEDFRVMGQEIQRLKRENEGLQNSKSKLIKELGESEDMKKQILEANNKIIQEKQCTIERKEETIQKMGEKVQELQKRLKEQELQIDERQRRTENLQRDLRDKDLTIVEKQHTIERKDETIQKKEQEIQELQKKLRKREESQIDERQNRKETQLTMENRQKDLCDRNRTIEWKDERILKMEEKIQELQKKLQDKELHINGMQSGKETQLSTEKLHKDLRDKERTIEENHVRIQKMGLEIQQLQNYILEMENKFKQERAGQNMIEGKETGKSQRYGERSSTSGQEDDEHRSCSWQMKHEGSLWDRTQRSPHTMYDQRLNPTEIQSPTSPDLIEQLKRTIQEKDEEIQRLKSDLDEKMSLINDILEQKAQTGKQKV